MKLRSVEIVNFRGLSKIQIELDDTTVLIGENNTGKTSVLHALRCGLERVRSRRGCSFSEYDYHLGDAGGDPTTAPEITITLGFREDAEGDTAPDLVRVLGDVIVYDQAGKACLWLRVRSGYDPMQRDFTQTWEFLNDQGEAMVGKAAQPEILSALQRTRPIFYLSALRDAGKEFAQRSQFWGPFLKSMSLDPDRKRGLEEMMGELNAEIIDAHGSFDDIRERLQQIQGIVAVGADAVVSIEALPIRLFDVLSRTQVGISSPTNASLPVGQHGEGTQSLAVLLLFDAFVRSQLGSAYDTLAVPIVALEEPEAHLHPCAVRAMWRLTQALKGQKIVATHSGDLVAEVPLSSIRRLHRRSGAVVVSKVDMDQFTGEDIRKLNYHVRQARGELLFARVWLLVEGETDVCVLTEAAQILQLDLVALGIRCVAFQASTGVEPLLKLANQLGIEWHGLADGDDAGTNYRAVMMQYLCGRNEEEHISIVPANNMDVYLCSNGLSHVYERHLDVQKPVGVESNDPAYPEALVKALPNKVSKPAIAFEAMCDVSEGGAQAVPVFIREVLNKATSLAEKAS